jgi:hypothetical protein
MKGAAMTDTTSKPTPSENQNGPGSPTADGRIWYSDPTHALGGYYIDPDPDQAAKDAAARAKRAGNPADPYDVPGLYAVGSQIFMGYNASMASHVQADLLEYCKGDQAEYNRIINENALADPTWNNAVRQVVVNGATVAHAWHISQKGVGGNMQDPKFTEAQIQSGSDFLGEYKKYE